MLTKAEASLMEKYTTEVLLSVRHRATRETLTGTFSDLSSVFYTIKTIIISDWYIVCVSQTCVFFGSQ